MSRKLNRALLTLGVAGALAVPSVALAHDGRSGSGRGGDDQVQPAQGSSSADDSQSTAAETESSGSESQSSVETHGGRDSGGSDRSRGHDANRTERSELRGTVVSVDPAAQTITVAVKKANHGRRGRSHLGQTITFDVSSARLDVSDVNGDGVRDLNDVAQGDAVEVRAELPRSGSIDLTQPVAAERLKDRS